MQREWVHVFSAISGSLQNPLRFLIICAHFKFLCTVGARLINCNVCCAKGRVCKACSWDQSTEPWTGISWLHATVGCDRSAEASCFQFRSIDTSVYTLFCKWQHCHFTRTHAFSYSLVRLISVNPVANGDGEYRSHWKKKQYLEF